MGMATAGCHREAALSQTEDGERGGISHICEYVSFGKHCDTGSSKPSMASTELWPQVPFETLCMLPVRWVSSTRLARFCCREKPV